MKNLLWGFVNSIQISLEFHLIFTILFIHIRSSPPNPLISYCTSETDSLSVFTDCNFTTISISTFEFGKIHENVIQVNSKFGPKFVFVRCDAQYPIRWSAPKPLGSVYSISLNETNRFHQDPLTISKTNLSFYRQVVLVNTGEEFMPKLRCESYSSPMMAAEVFINGIEHGNDNEDVWDFSAGYSQHFVIDETGTKSGGFIIPALAKEFQGNYTLRVTKSDGDASRLKEVDDKCAECICRASSHCETFPCDSEHVCGDIPWEYYNVGKSFRDCKRHEICVLDLIENYYYEKRREETEFDCNEDGVLTCEDFFWIHIQYSKDQCAPLSSVGTGNTSTLTECLHKKQLNFTRLSTGPRDYDPRIGLKVYELPDPSFKYEFNIPWGLSFGGSMTVHPFRADARINGKLYISKSLNLIKCEVTALGNYAQPTIVVGKCETFSECQLKFESPWPFVFNTGYKKMTNQFERSSRPENIRIQSFATTYSQGYLECNGVYNPEFLNIIDYFFTGLDNTKYLVSELFPIESIIKISTKQEQPMRVGVTYSFDCKISTFILLPNIQFVLSFQNGVEQLVTVMSQTTEATIENAGRLTNTATLTWQLHVRVNVGLNKITCYAPRINSSVWAQSAINIKAETFNSTNQLHPKFNFSGWDKPEGNPGKETDQLYLYFKIGGVIGGVTTISLLILIAVVATRKTSVVVKNLSPEEVEEFIFGTATQNPDQSENFDVENMAFKPEFRICEQDLIIGHFGVVHQGQYRDRDVAIKSCKPNADREYFKAFLKEVKVMAYLGEHESIVMFWGAVVDDLANGKCQAVIELSPFGNLNNHLRKLSEQSEESRYVYLLSDEEEPESSHQLPLILNYCKQIAKGMEYMAHKKVIHGDLATRNVLVFEKHVVKITDFGLSRKLYTCENYTKQSKVPLPWAWMALESLCFKEFSTKTDVWSFGVTTWEIFSMGRTPFCGLRPADFTNQVEAGLRLTKPALASDEIYNFMLTCWDKSPRSRPTFTECVDFFASLEP